MRGTEEEHQETPDQDNTIASWFGIRVSCSRKRARTMFSDSLDENPHVIAEKELAVYTAHVNAMLNDGVSVKGFNVFDFWDSMKQKLPFMYIVAMRLVCTLIMRALLDRFLTIPPVSVECERLFSSAGLINTPLRSRLTDSHLETLCFLKHNFKNKKLWVYVMKKMGETERDDEVLSETDSENYLDESRW